MNPSEFVNKQSEWLKEAGGDHVKESSSNLRHISTTLATILGISIGLGSSTATCAIKISWLLQITTIGIAIFYLIMESKSRYRRQMISGLSLMLIATKAQKENRPIRNEELTQPPQDLMNSATGKAESDDLSDRFYAWFTLRMTRIETIIYILFFISLLTLVIGII